MRYNKRDENGWRMPRAGTRSHNIYMMTLAGCTPTQIAAVTGIPVNIVRVLRHRFKHPDETNAAKLAQATAKRQTTNSVGVV